MSNVQTSMFLFHFRLPLNAKCMKNLYFLYFAEDIFNASDIQIVRKNNNKNNFILG